MKYSFEIREVLSKVVVIEADSFVEALQEAHEMYDEEKVVLTADDCCEVSITECYSEEVGKEKLLVACNEYRAREGFELLDKLPADGILHMAFTTYDFPDGEEREVQVDFDVNRMCYLNYIDDELVLEEFRANLSDVADEISWCSFDSMIQSAIDKGCEIYKESTFLLFSKWDDEEVWGVRSLSRSELIDYIDLSDCYPPDLDWKILEISGNGIVYPCHYTGWQPGCLIEVARDYDGIICLSGHGTDH